MASTAAKKLAEEATSNMEAAASNGASTAQKASQSIDVDNRITRGLWHVSRTSWKIGWGLVALGAAGDIAIIASRQFQKAWVEK